MFFICKECSDTRNEMEVIVLDCKHCFCLVCFEKYLLANLAKDIKCPSSRCNTKVTENQLRSVLSDNDLEKYDRLCMEGLSNIHKCLLPECNSIIQYQDGVSSYTCSKCSLWNCIQCNFSHNGVTCDVYKKMSEDGAKRLGQESLEKANEVYVYKNRLSVMEAAGRDLLTNEKVFECNLCCHCIGKGKGIRLRSCFHYICRPCLINLVKTTDTFPVRCQKSYCVGVIEDREVKCILSKNEYEVHHQRMLKIAMSNSDNYFHCRQPNCEFFGELFDKNRRSFKCPICRTKNCLICRDVHPGRTCREHQQNIVQADSMIESSILRGEFMICPGCENYVTRSRGCNWIKCPRCNLELCWILKMRRWGPLGPGDKSGGCKCEVNNYCHPLCTGCIPDR